CVLPTYYDSCRIVVLEALACWLPVITTKVNGVHEFMEQGRDGFVMSDPEALEELVSYMTTLLDPDRRAEASRAARALAEQHTVERNCDEHVGVYEEVIQARQNAG
ncbi:MAG: glycosyltransferase, partial [Planctomycetes bacterium]|nr:glycosyltransferase [Planctomycetota bacterium]